MMASRRRLLPVLAGIALSTSACVGVGGAPDLGGAFGPPPSSLAQQRPRPAPQSGGDVLGTADLQQLYQALIEIYVDPVDPQRLVAGALRGAREASTQAGLLPVESGVFDTATVRPGASAELAWAQLADAYDDFLQKLVRRVDVTGVGQGAAEGMVAAVADPSTRYYRRNALEAQQLADYVGVGVVLAPTAERGSPVVREVTPGSPGDTAGVKLGDVIVAVGGRSTDNMTLAEAVEAIRGAEGTLVSLTVRSQGVERETEVRRGVVRANVVSSEVRSGVTFIRVRAMQDGATQAIRNALIQTTTPTRGWVLDLRGSDRGSLQEAVNVASLFVGDQIVALQEDKAGRRNPIRGTGRPVSQLPGAVVVDEGTGGPAEVLAGALRDLGVARVIGTRTAGKAARTTPVPLPDGSVAQIASHRLLAPGGSPLHRVGLAPDEVVEATAQDWVAGRDVQLEQAVARLGA